MLNKPIKLGIRPTSLIRKTEFENKPKVDIVSLYEKLIGGPTKKTGRSVLVRCCFHEERTPSLALYPDTSSYFCFACNKHGDAYNFVEEVLHCNFKEALEFIKNL